MSPRRREFLAATAGAAVLALAGCSDGGSELNAPSEDEGGTPTPTDPTPNLDIVGGMLPDFGDDGVSIDVTVENRGEESSSATLFVVASDGAGESRLTRETSVSLDPGDSETYTFEFDLTRETYTGEEWGVSAELRT
jgi:hypothetical protein